MPRSAAAVFTPLSMSTTKGNVMPFARKKTFFPVSLWSAEIAGPGVLQTPSADSCATNVFAIATPLADRGTLADVLVAAEPQAAAKSATDKRAMTPDPVRMGVCRLGISPVCSCTFFPFLL